MRCELPLPFTSRCGPPTGIELDFVICPELDDDDDAGAGSGDTTSSLCGGRGSPPPLGESVLAPIAGGGRLGVAPARLDQALAAIFE